VTHRRSRRSSDAAGTPGTAVAAGRRARRSDRPARTVFAASLTLFGVCVAVTTLVGTPWVVFAPGPVVDTLGRVGGRQVVAVTGRPTYPSASRLDLTTVSTTLPGTTVDLWQAAAAWWDPHEDLEPDRLVYPASQTAAQAAAEGQQQMAGAQSSAVVAAARELGLPIRAQVGSVAAGSPAAGRLRAGDVLLAVDGTPAGSSAAVVRVVRRLRPGAVVELQLLRGGTQRAVAVRAAHGPGGDSGVPTTSPYLGVGLQDAAPSVTADIDLGQQIGGPSAGTMFALAIVDRLTPGSLAGTAHVAGTGTITGDGTVGVIGGVRQKIAGARAAGATFFLVPSGNCAEAATAAVPGIRLVRVATLAGAVAALHVIAAGSGTLPGCTS